VALKLTEGDYSDVLREECNLILRKVRKGKIKDGILQVMKTLGLKKG